MSESILITGGAGFAGAHVVEHILKNTAYNVIVLDKLSYASNGLDRLREIKAIGNTLSDLEIANLLLGSTALNLLANT